MAIAHANTEYLFSGVVMRFILTGRETGGKFCLFENRSSGNSSSPVHVHALEDETIHVLDGEMEAVISGVAHRAQAGEAVFMPRGVPHQLRSTSGKASRYLVLCTPSGFEEFVAAAGREKGPADPAVTPSAGRDRTNEGSRALLRHHSVTWFLTL